MSPDFILQVLLAVGAGCAVYAGIKSDLTRSIMLAEQAQREAADAMKDSKSAHVRISTHVERFHT